MDGKLVPQPRNRRRSVLWEGGEGARRCMCRGPIKPGAVVPTQTGEPGEHPRRSTCSRRCRTAGREPVHVFCEAEEAIPTIPTRICDMLSCANTALLFWKPAHGRVGPSASGPCSSQGQPSSGGGGGRTARVERTRFDGARASAATRLCATV